MSIPILLIALVITPSDSSHPHILYRPLPSHPPSESFCFIGRRKKSSFFQCNWTLPPISTRLVIYEPSFRQIQPWHYARIVTCNQTMDAHSVSKGVSGAHIFLFVSHILSDIRIVLIVCAAGIIDTTASHMFLFRLSYLSFSTCIRDMSFVSLTH